jgi:hypothetical protein
MKKQLTYVSPLRAGIIFGILYGLLSLIVLPFFLLAAIFGSKGSSAIGALGMLFAIMLPVIYAVLGFIGGLIAAALYNVVAKWTGGFEFETQDVPPSV